jgi:hypothetical protein
MKSLHEILEIIKVQHPNIYAEVEKLIIDKAKTLGILKVNGTEHPVKPPLHP